MRLELLSSRWTTFAQNVSHVGMWSSIRMNETKTDFFIRNPRYIMSFWQHVVRLIRNTKENYSACEWSNTSQAITKKKQHPHQASIILFARWVIIEHLLYLLDQFWSSVSRCRVNYITNFCRRHSIGLIKRFVEHCSAGALHRKEWQGPESQVNHIRVCFAANWVNVCTPC